MEEMKEQYDAALKERDIQSSEKDAALRKAALQIQFQRILKNEKEYNTQLSEYNEAMESYISEHLGKNKIFYSHFIRYNSSCFICLN